MNATMVVMLIMVGSYHGGPATIQGFSTLEACKSAIATVQASYMKTQGFGSTRNIPIECVELPK